MPTSRVDDDLATRQSGGSGGPKAPLGSVRIPGDVTARLVRRTSYGPTLEEINRAKTLGYNAYLEEQLNHLAINDSVCEAQVQNLFPRVFMNSTQLGAFSDDWVTQEQMRDAHIWRCLHSKRQLFHRMVEFWNDHFSIHIDKVGGWLMVPYQNQVIRQHALGKFPDMLRAQAQSAAMMIYLDNAWSFAGQPNQNYARELLELYTLDVDNGYTQQDVIEVARCFTGWSMIWDNTHAQNGQFIFQPYEWWHDNGAKTVFGTQIPAGGGQQDGFTVLNLLANHPNTAWFIATKLVRHFIQDEAPARVVRAVAQTYQRTGGDIKAMLRTLFMWRNIQIAEPKFKRPNLLFYSGLRGLKSTVTQVTTLRWWFLNLAGHMPFDWAPPNGYPDAAGYWSGLIMPRWNFGLSLLHEWIDGLRIQDLNTLVPANTVTGIAERIDALLFAGEMNDFDYAELIRYLQAAPITADRKRGAIALAMASPSFQYV